MCITQAATCHIFRDKMYLQTGNIWPRWLPCFPSLYSIHTDVFKPIYIPYKIFSGMLLILLPLEFYRNFTTTTMETAEYWLMACKYAIWNAAIASLQFWAEDLDAITLSIASECIYTTFFWMPHTMSTIWRCSIWMFCHSIKCSVHPVVIIIRWGLWEWFWHYWSTHSLKEYPSHTPHV